MRSGTLRPLTYAGFFACLLHDCSLVNLGAHALCLEWTGSRRQQSEVVVRHALQVLCRFLLLREVHRAAPFCGRPLPSCPLTSPPHTHTGPSPRRREVTKKAKAAARAANENNPAADAAAADEMYNTLKKVDEEFLRLFMGSGEEAAGEETPAQS